MELSKKARVVSLLLFAVVAGCKDDPKAAPERRPTINPGSLRLHASSHGPHLLLPRDGGAAASSAPAVPLGPLEPIDAALPASSKTLPAKPVVCDAKNRCDFSKSMFLNGYAKSEKAPATVVGLELGAGGTFEFPFFEGLSLAVVVLDGSLDASLPDTKETKTLGPWQALYAPNGLAKLTPKDAGARALVVIGTHAGDPVDARLVDDYKKTPPVKRVGPARFVDFTKIDDQAWGHGAYHARIGWEARGDDKPAFVVDVLRFSKNASVAEHDHSSSWEVLAALEGAGTLMTSPSDSKPSTSIVEPGSVDFIPPGVKHRFDPSGKSDLLAVQVYSPPGPEQRFKTLAAATAPSAQATPTAAPSASPEKK